MEQLPKLWTDWIIRTACLAVIGLAGLIYSDLRQQLQDATDTNLAVLSSLSNLSERVGVIEVKTTTQRRDLERLFVMMEHLP